MAEERDPVEPQGDDGGGTDWKAEARKWEKRAKAHADYDELKAKAARLDELEEANKTGIQKAQEEASRYKAELDELKAKAERDELVAKVAKETGVPAQFIVGGDEDEMRAYAKSLSDHFKPGTAPRTPKSSSFDTGGASGEDDAKREFARKLFGKDE